MSRISVALAAVLVLALTLTLLSTGAPTAYAQSASSASAEQASPRIIALKFHADWCGYCKAMGPVFEELQAKYDHQPVLYLTLDQTRDFGRRQSQYLAGALGFDDIWREHGGKTGFILLVDAETGDVAAKLTHEQNLKQMGAALVDAVNAAT